MENYVYYILEYLKSAALSKPFIIYIFAFLNAALQIYFPPYPGDTITIIQGFLSSKGYLNIYLLLFSTLLGTYLSSISFYLLGFKYGKSLLSKTFIRKYFNSNIIEKIETWFKKYGSFAIIINKFIPGIGSITFIAAGILELPPIPAFLSIAVATFLHNTIIIIAGRLTGDNIMLIKQVISEYNKIVIISLFLIIIMYSYIKLFYRRKNKI